MNHLETQLMNLMDEWKSHTSGKVNDRHTALEMLKTAETIMDKGIYTELPDNPAREYLLITGKKNYLSTLNGYDERARWAETAFYFIRRSRYGLLELMEDRISEHPDKILFEEVRGGSISSWSYRRIGIYARDIASAFYSLEKKPVVAIYSDNSVHSASCDLACLFYGIVNTPLNTSFSVSILEGIFREMEINIAVTDTPERADRLKRLRDKSGMDFHIIITSGDAEPKGYYARFLGSLISSLDELDKNKHIESRQRPDIRSVATVMFTSGSTGRPKGVSFSIYNLISKRFGRHAALPNVGDDEVLLCFLPLYHTFGRYLEMMGMLYWGGKYVFTANPSAETLFHLFPIINPTGFISIPLRWAQIYERSMEKIDIAANSDPKEAIQSVAGTRLRWGLSAAGYLNPAIFMFFQKNGIELCSGFGMTEATGGITMTPPGEYIKNSTGRGLPGVKLTLSVQGEMLLSGHYIARYFDDKKPGDIIPFPDDDPSYKLPTGDIFRKLDNGHYEIVDRLKDIYKNNRGQTVAPRNVEKKFEGVPGIKRTFLVGDGKPFNVLFIVPDDSDEVFNDAPDDEKKEYYHQIVTAANEELANYERVINFTVLERDFQLLKGELTPKGSYNRKKIEQNFSEIIEGLYKSNVVELRHGPLLLKIPRWIYRDLGILESDIILKKNGIYNRRKKIGLKVQALDNGRFLIGNLEYELKESIIDLGIFAKQPRLWLGNPGLISFLPCREGWETTFDNISRQQFLHDGQKIDGIKIPELKNVRDRAIPRINELIINSLFKPELDSAGSIRQLGSILKDADAKYADVIRARLGSLATHPIEDIRCLAYTILLLDEPNPDYSTTYPTFLKSNKTFLNEKSIREIAGAQLERRRLEALRKRLYAYRHHLDWPVNPDLRKQFEYVFKLLVNFIEKQPEFYNSVRLELTNWIMHKEDIELSKIAEKYLRKLWKQYESALEKEMTVRDPQYWKARFIFDENLDDVEIQRIEKVLINTTFLKQSILLAFDENKFCISDVPEEGIWISRINNAHKNFVYRIAISTYSRKHYDLQMILREELRSGRELESVYWLLVIQGYPFGERILPKPGCARPELQARSMIYHSELTVWEKIREISSLKLGGKNISEMTSLRKLFISALTAFFRGWLYSGRRILPGEISPNNVIVPELDFKEGATILSLNGWKNYEGPMSLIQPIAKYFYQKTLSHYSWSRYQLDLNWIPDAVIESLGYEDGAEFLKEILDCLDRQSDILIEKQSFRRVVEKYLEEGINRDYMPLAQINAIDRYHEWHALNPDATAEAKGEFLKELYRLYRLYNYPEIVRFNLYKNTYYYDAGTEIRKAFSILLDKMSEDKSRPATQLVELSELQSVMKIPDDRKIFTEMVFTRIKKPGELKIEVREEKDRKNLIVKSEIKDKYGAVYSFKEPESPKEVGSLYRLFFKEKYPKTITQRDQFFVIADEQERIVGGICYRDEEGRTVYLDGTVVESSLSGRGIGSAMIEDFCARMAERRYKLVKTHFYLPKFYQKHGFRIDRQWGAMVREL
ncbi:MAG: GNAT family N-acetyltransferase [Candidatus Kapaibacterium sp.]